MWCHAIARYREVVQRPALIAIGVAAWRARARLEWAFRLRWALRVASLSYAKRACANVRHARAWASLCDATLARRVRRSAVARAVALCRTRALQNGWRRWARLSVTFTIESAAFTGRMARRLVAAHDAWREAACGWRLRALAIMFARSKALTLGFEQRRAVRRARGRGACHLATQARRHHLRRAWMALYGSIAPSEGRLSRRKSGLRERAGGGTHASRERYGLASVPVRRCSGA